MSVGFHDVIMKWNVLEKPTNDLKEYLLDHPSLYKIALLANHLFRSIAMYGLHTVLPFSPLGNLAIGLFGSLFYRVTVETNCAYKFALPAFAGAVALKAGEKGVSEFVSGLAIKSLSSFALSISSLVPFLGYLTYIVLTVDYDANKQCGNL